MWLWSFGTSLFGRCTCGSNKLLVVAINVLWGLGSGTGPCCWLEFLIPFADVLWIIGGCQPFFVPCYFTSLNVISSDADSVVCPLECFCKYSTGCNAAVIHLECPRGVKHRIKQTNNSLVSMGQKPIFGRKLAAILVFRPAAPYIGTKFQTKVIFSSVMIFCTKKNCPPAYLRKHPRIAHYYLNPNNLKYCHIRIQVC